MLYFQVFRTQVSFLQTSNREKWMLGRSKFTSMLIYKIIISGSYSPTIYMSGPKSVVSSLRLGFYKVLLAASLVLQQCVWVCLSLLPTVLLEAFLFDSKGGPRFVFSHFWCLVKDSYSTYVQLAGVHSRVLTNLSVLKHCVPCGPSPDGTRASQISHAPLLTSAGIEMRL